MSAYAFEWNSSKALANFKKHGVSFDEAKTVFYDEFARLIADPDSSHGEERFILLGVSSHMNTLVVCHCFRASDEHIRIISARRANKREQKQYEGFRHA